MNQVVTKLVVSLMLALNCNDYLLDPKFNTTQFGNLTTDVRDPNQGQNITINQVLGFNFNNESCSPEDMRRGGLTFFDYAPNVLEVDNQYTRVRTHRKVSKLLVFKVMPDRKCSEIRRDFGKKLKEEKSPNISKMFICNLCGDDDVDSHQCEQRLGLYVGLRWSTIEFNLTNLDSDRMTSWIVRLRRINLLPDGSGGIRSNWIPEFFIKSHRSIAKRLQLADFCPQVCAPKEPLSLWIWLFGLVFGVLGVPFYSYCCCMLIDRHVEQ